MMRDFSQEVRTHLLSLSSLSLSLFWGGVGRGGPFNGIWYNEYVMMNHLKGYT